MVKIPNFRIFFDFWRKISDFGAKFRLASRSVPENFVQICFSTGEGAIQLVGHILVVGQNPAGQAFDFTGGAGVHGGESVDLIFNEKI